ncbi:hypothetical protein FRC00_004761 [Tulasnella sp. 408]|nr:hypothetical protein FRC00_004761 [Tulasnella sp. 408]
MALSGDQDHSFDSNSVQLEIRQEHTVQELRGLTPSLAFHHKNLIIDALNDAIQLQCNNPDGNALLKFLDRLQRFALDGADPNADRQEYLSPADETATDDSSSDTIDLSYPGVGDSFQYIATDDVAYGYRSLSPQWAGTSPTSHNYPVQVGEDGGLMFTPPPNNTCTACLMPIEEGCASHGTYQRWHLQCIACTICGKSAGRRSNAQEGSAPGSSSETSASPELGGRSGLAYLGDFSFGFFPELRIYCMAHTPAGSLYCYMFEIVSRLEQYAFSLNVAIRRSHYNLLGQGDILAVAGEQSIGDK